MLSLLQPFALLLVPLPWLLRRLLPAVLPQGRVLTVPFFAELAALATHGAGTTRGRDLQRWLLLGLWCALVLALARPVWLGPPQQLTLPTRDLLLAVDLSQSMNTEDFATADGQRVSRWTQVRGLLRDFLGRRAGDRIGLVVFGSSAFVQLPPTSDAQLIAQLLEETAVGMAGPRTQIGDAMGLALALFANSELPQQVLLLITDGNDTGSTMPPHELARIAAERSVTVHVIGIGDPQAVGERPLDEQTLREVAQLAGGRYFRALDAPELAAVYTELDQLAPSEQQLITEQPVKPLFHWVFAAAWCLLLLLPVCARRSPVC